jgi:hypothetical protein
MRHSIAALITCAALFTGLPVGADQADQRTTLTFSQPVELPGVILPAGKYVFKLVNVLSYRHVIQVSNAEETMVLATLLAIPDYRMEPTADTVVWFAERPANRPQGDPRMVLSRKELRPRIRVPEGTSNGTSSSDASNGSVR